MTLLLSAMSSSKEDLRESLSKPSNQDISETALQAMEFFKDSFNVFDDDNEEEEESVNVAEERDYLLGNKHSFANGFEVADADVIVAAVSPIEYRLKVPKAASKSGGKNEICAKAYLDRLPCTITKKMPECVGDSFNFGNHYWTVSQKAVEKYKTDRNLNFDYGDRREKRLPKDGPFSERNVKPYRSCAIVASSKALRGKNLGAKIDNHEVVMRMNGAPTKGYEKDVGFKTTFRVQHGVFRLARKAGGSVFRKVGGGKRPWQSLRLGEDGENESARD